MSDRTFKLLFYRINAKIMGYLYKDAYIVRSLRLHLVASKLFALAECFLLCGVHVERCYNIIVCGIIIFFADLLNFIRLSPVASP